MNENKSGNYQRILEKMIERIRQESHLTAEALDEWLDKTADMVGAAKELSQDEWDLMKESLKRDFHTFADSVSTKTESHPPSVWLEGISESLWHGLAEITDKTQCEWTELAEDLKHDGIYKANQWVGLGVLRCIQCGHEQEIYHPTKLSTCVHCNGDKFQREAFRP